jgi:hypothetical protein
MLQSKKSLSAQLGRRSFEQRIQIRLGNCTSSLSSSPFSSELTTPFSAQLTDLKLSELQAKLIQLWGTTDEVRQDLVEKQVFLARRGPAKVSEA